MDDYGYDMNGFHDDHCEGPNCNCDSRRYGGVSYNGSGVVAFIWIALAFLVAAIFPPLGFIIFWSWVIGTK